MATSDLCEALKRHAAVSSGAPENGSSSSAGYAYPPSGYSSQHGHPQHGQPQMLDANMEKKICRAVLNLLNDSSNDVQAIAVKTLGVLLRTVHEEQVQEIAASLCTLVLDSSKSELRDVYAIGLRTLVKTVPLHMGDVVSHHLVGRLVEGIRSNSSLTPSSAASKSESKQDDRSTEEIILACLDVLNDILTRFGSTSVSITRQHDQILNTTLAQLASERPVVRKRAGNTVGCLSSVISDPLLFRLVENLLSQIDLAEGVGRSGRRRTRQAHTGGTGTSSTMGAPAVSDTRALIRTMCTVSGAVGHRLGQEQIDRIVPIFLRFCDPDDAATGDDEEDSEDEDMEDANEDKDEAAIALANELRESCFAGFESFVLRCPKEVKPHLPKIIHSALAYLSYDPNYSYGEDDEDETQDDDEDEFSDGDDYEEEDDDDDDDDDGSWKVRRSAICAILAVVEATKDDPSKLWMDEYTLKKKETTVAAALVNRFKEREENCRVDVIGCFTRLLALTVAAAKAGVLVFSNDAMDTSELTAADGPVVIDLGSNYVSAIVKACEKQLSAKKGGERSKSAALALLSTLCTAPGGIGGAAQIRSVFTHIKSILSFGSSGDGGKYRSTSVGGNSKTLKLDALSLVRIMISSDHHDASIVKDALSEILLPELCRSVEEDWYKVIAEALRVLAEIPLLLATSTDKAERDQVASSLCSAILPRLAAHDLDQEIKECALTASSTLLSVLHESLTEDQKNEILKLLQERLANETTRIAAIKTLSVIAADNKGTKVDLSPILADTVSELASLLRQQNRSLKQHALEALDIIVSCHWSDSPTAMNEVLFEVVLKELGGIIVDSDLHISHLSLRTSSSILRVCSASGPSVKLHVLPACLELSSSPLLRDQALKSILELLEQLITSNAVAFDELLSALQGRLSGTEKLSVSNLAKCIAAITSVTTVESREAVVGDIIGSLESALAQGSDDAMGSKEIQLSLLTSGELGRLVDLSAVAGVADRLQNIYLTSFDSTSEEAKHSAAYALGRASVGSMSVFLPAILTALEQNSEKKQYLLLSALRELIHCHQLGDGGDISSSVPEILPHLIKHASDKEEGVRTMSAECLGSLACLHPSVVFPTLRDLVVKHGSTSTSGDASSESAETKDDALVCWTVATSIKFAIAGRADAKVLSEYMPSFLVLLQNDDLSVKNAALLMVYSAVHHTPAVVAGLLQDHILPSLYELAVLNLKRVVDLGPFKHTVDDALPTRKSTLSIFSKCLENCPGSLDIPMFMPILAKALEDVEDVQLQAHHIVISMCAHHPLSVISAVESFVEPLEKTLNKKKGQKTGTELERLNDWIKSGLRVMVTLSHVDGSMSCRKFAEFVERTKKNVKYQSMLESIAEER